MANYSKEDLLNEIRCYMLAMAASMWRAFHPDAGWGLLGLNKSDFESEYVDDLKVEDVDPYSFEVTRVLLPMYDYAVNGLCDYMDDEGRNGFRRLGSEHSEVWVDFATDTLMFIDSIRNFSLMEEGFSLRDRRFPSSVSTHISQYVAEAASARWTVDDKEGDWPITFNALALLAGMDEKSVRNAANPKLPNALKTIKDEDGRTRVDSSDAFEWLKTKRGFKPTTSMPSISASRDLKESGFLGVEDFGNFLVGLRAKKSKKLDAMVEELAYPYLTEKRIAALERGQFKYEKAAFEKLADYFEIDKAAFLRRSLELHQRLEREALESQLTAEEEWERKWNLQDTHL